MKKILVTGGCGYIGSHTLVDLIEHGFDVVCVDSLVNSDGSALEGVYRITGKRIINHVADLTKEAETRRLFDQHPDIDGIIHFAALKLVGESVEKPLLYYRNNLLGLLNILQSARDYHISNLIFSSSCSVYGNATDLPVTENTPVGEAESPYARTKQMGEAIIRDNAAAKPGLRAILLRYFNPAGAHTSNEIGESPRNKPSNLAPVITETAIGRRAEMIVFGNDYPTRDGTCIRDYIHVMDLAHAHTLAMERLLSGDQEIPVDVINLGIGEGVTVMEAIRAFEAVSGHPLKYRIGPRRPGDVVAIYSDYRKARELLGWEPKMDIRQIMATAWAWEQKRSG